MENRHVEIHDPFSGHNGLSSSTDQNPTSLTDSTEVMVEFRILMAYAKRRRHGEDAESSMNPDTPNGNIDSHGTSSPETPNNTEEVTEKKKKKKFFKRFAKVFTCLKPQVKEDEPHKIYNNQSDAEDRCGDFGTDDNKEEDQLEEVASRLTKISDEIPFVRPDLETDAPDDDVEKVIGLLLRETGDQLNERELKDAALVADLLGNYTFFEKVIMAFLTRLGLRTSNPEALGPKASPKTQIAVACEVTSRLSVLDTLPMKQMMGHGARYLNIHYSSWAEQQGGYEKAFEDEDEDEVQ